MSAQSPELQAKIQLWREKTRNGTITPEESAEAIAALRKARASVPTPAGGSSVNRAAAKVAKAAKAKPNGDDLLSGLEGL